MSESLRKCADCGLEAHTEEELELFKKCTTNKHGRQNICKTCHNKRTRYYFKTHKEERKIYHKKYQETHKKERNEYSHRLYAANREKFAEYQRKYRKSHLEHRLGRKRKNRPRIPLETVKKLLERTNGVCEHNHKEECHKILQIHHIDENPLNNDLNNLMLLCTRHHAKIHPRTHGPQGRFTKLNPSTTDHTDLRVCTR